jgi:hypothetical protein
MEIGQRYIKFGLLTTKKLSKIPRLKMRMVTRTPKQLVAPEYIFVLVQPEME